MFVASYHLSVKSASTRPLSTNAKVCNSIASTKGTILAIVLLHPAQQVWRFLASCYGFQLPAGRYEEVLWLVGAYYCRRRPAAGSTATGSGILGSAAAGMAAAGTAAAAGMAATGAAAAGAAVGVTGAAAGPLAE